ncbi:hypothetical protein [Endozoicomonas sp. ALC066]|uniref:hypothetical protein n=1 Tax=Endozoicomonas sp. ALC066 TaxID=3403078 RepID=UPI003BB7F4EA
MRKIQPIFDKLVIRRLDTEPTSKGGILLTGKQEESMEAEIVAIGPQCVHFKEGMEGTKVTLARYANPNKVKHGDDSCEIIDEKDVYGIIYED